MGLRGTLKAGLKKLLGGERPEVAAPVRRAPTTALPTEPDSEGFRAVAAEGTVTVGHAGQYAVHGTTVAVFRVGEGLHGVDNACLHEDGPLGEGEQDGAVVACPYHDWRYDVRTGKCLTKPERRLACYPARERAGFLWVGPARGKSSGDRGGEHADGLRTAD